MFYLLCVVRVDIIPPWVEKCNRKFDNIVPVFLDGCFARMYKTGGGEEMEYLKELNPEQYEAATTTEGFIRVVAGAGSGKT